MSMLDADAGASAAAEVGSAEGTVEDGNLGGEFTEASAEVGTTEGSVDQPRYSVKVNGEDREVSLDELRSGFMLQADYTRKTQELAEKKSSLARAEAIAAALEVDPVATLQALNEAYGQSTSYSQQQQASYEELSPEEQRLSRIEQQQARWASDQLQAQIDRELGTLRDAYGDFDSEALLVHALKKQIPDLGAAYRDWKFDEVNAQAQARSAAAQQAAEADAKVTDAKRGAAFVEGGGSVASGSVGSQPESFSSIRGAFLAALKEHG